ncbi:zinc ribbon domain-containing protein [Mitsuokella multacida]|uniref:zinc ribbon domain-containing protein n=2 Tax=Mitsuokella multacida TaxID=52226 RepID=UPI003C7C2AC2
MCHFNLALWELLHLDCKSCLYDSAMFCLCYVLPVGQRLHLSDRQWQCPSCHVLHDRDRNAACNILQRGLASLIR